MVRINNIFLSIIIIFSVSTSKLLNAQSNDNGSVIIDDSGLLKWQSSGNEIKGFGVNYTMPFAHAFRSAKRLGIDVKDQIDKDLYHFKRLGFDLYRIHVWDTQISDADGNLIENEHLDTFDYLLDQLAYHGFNYVITPIAFWGDGWPEPDSQTKGFSSIYDKTEALVNPKAIEAQQNYLAQFLEHVNPYSKVALKNDPQVLAFEVSNEPHHRGTSEEVTKFVKAMVDAVTSTGTKKPIFYNMSHAVHFMDAYFKGGVQGGTFQWYPTGLGYGRELEGNLLPNVDAYTMPFDSVFKKYKGAKLVYEFDAADVGRSYIYPIMARSFRSAGIQIATHFAYDPTFLAPHNTEYNTHFMNLNYTPKKALALKISSKVFHEVPMHSDFGVYPENTSFGNFYISYQKDLAVYNSEDEFIYTNSTEIVPKNEADLISVSGYGTSPIISYSGTGAYFLDKLDTQNWRLEVMPDAVWVDDPFGKNSPKKIVAVTKSETRTMQLFLKDLGSDFMLKPLNDGNDFRSTVNGNTFQIKPGTYLISAKQSDKQWVGDDAFQTYQLKSFYATTPNLNKDYISHQPPSEVSSDKAHTVKLKYVSPKQIDSIRLEGYSSSDKFSIKMNETKAFVYEAMIPSEIVSVGNLHYHVLVYTKDRIKSYPEARDGKPSDWDFYDPESYKIRVVPSSNPIYLFNAIDDADQLVRTWRPGSKLVPTENYKESEFQLYLKSLFVEDEENLNVEPINDYSFKHFILEAIKGRRQDLDKKTTLVFKGRAFLDQPETVQIALVLKDGSSFGKTFKINSELKPYELDLRDFKPAKTVTLPRPYPSFLPYYLEHNMDSDFDINAIESLQISIGPGLNSSELKKAHHIGIVSIYLK